MVLGFKDKKGNFRPTGERPTGQRSGIYYQKGNDKTIPANVKNFEYLNVNNFIQNRRDEIAYKKSIKEQNKKINENEKKYKADLKNKLDEREKKYKEITKQMDKGKITSGEAELLLNKVTGGNTKTRVVLPSGKIALDEMGQHHKRIIEKRIAENEKAQEDLTKQKSDNKTTKAKTATGSGNTSEDTKEWNDDLQKELDKLQIEKTKLELDLTEFTGGNPDTTYNKNAMVAKIEDPRENAGFLGGSEKGSSPSRKTESDEGSFPAGKTIRDREEKEARQALQYGDKIPTFTTIPYQKKRKDPYTGEYTSQMADTNIEKQIASLIENAEKQQGNDLSNEQLAEALESISKNVQTDPTQYETPKGMGALIGLRASMAGRQ